MVATLSQKQMELEGNLRAFPLSDILRFLAMGKMSGVLTFLNREHAIELTIRDGMLIGTTCGDRFPRLGQMLIYAGQITRKQLDEILENQRDGAPPPRMLGELLIEKGLVTQEQIENALKLQIREELWDLFSWTDGTFKFEHGLPPGRQRAMVTLEIEPLIDEGFEQLERWRVISGNLSDPDLVFRVSPELAALPAERLTPSTWRVLSLINGRHTVQVLIYLSGLGRFETICALDRLLALQLIEPLPGKRRAYASGRLAEGTGPAAPAGTRPAASDVITDVDEDDEGGLRGFFVKRRRHHHKETAATPPPAEERKPQAGKTGPFETPVGLACAMISRLAGRLCQESDFRGEGGPATLLEALWAEIGMRFPRADLIVLHEGTLDPQPLERYVRLAGGVDPALAGCHEDSMEALAQIGERLMRLGLERLGERARKLAAEALRPCLECSEIKFAPEFMPRLWAERWLG